MQIANFSFRCPFHNDKPLILKHEGNRHCCSDCCFFLEQQGEILFANYGPKNPFNFSITPQDINVVDRNESGLRQAYRKLTSTTSKSHYNFSNLKLNFANKKILIIGGGELGMGDCFEENQSTIRLDVYKGKHNSLLADAHAIPFANEEFDLVIIQAVLEHLLFPNKAISEIYRVLKDNGTVYSEVPFLQSVHEGIFDFSRYTMTGHCVLFKNFQIKEFGAVAGSRASLNWVVRDTFRSLGLKKIGTIFFTIFRIFGIILPNQNKVPACNGTFVLAQKNITRGGSITNLEDLGIYSGL